MSDALQIQQQINAFLNSRRISRVWFAANNDAPPVNACQVNFPRLSLVLSGTYDVQISDHGSLRSIEASPGDVIYIPAHCWDLPTWRQQSQTLTFMFAHRQIGLSLNQCSSTDQVSSLARTSIPEPLADEGILIQKAIEAIASSPNDNPAVNYLAEALIQHTSHLIPKETSHLVNRTQSRWEAICLYLQKNFGSEITRDKVAEEFAITPNHLSRLFRQEGRMGFNDYLTFVRIDRAKLLLSRYQLNLDEIATRTGFKGGDYLGRVFRKHTGLTPGEYRAKYARKELEAEQRQL
ncbi:helix-turn-helix transcriptional regulator [Endozoicomonas numazuensis]|uniref:helix-turn-helix transcriptional regulator n=1 Tax=Endozoicomonas numazuensis TaxID=1137799 RepID=UPI000689B267|nr:AraC family transcriptional regulator [Endozoicomonas numazuensis]